MRLWCLLTVSLLFSAPSLVQADDLPAKTATVHVYTQEDGEPLPLHEVERRIIARTNTQRARFGLRPLQICRNLMQSARGHARWMANSRNLTHTTAPVAENIAMGQHNSGQAVQDWMNSSGHRANILNASYSRMGAAAYRAADGRVYWCQQFLH